MSEPKLRKYTVHVELTFVFYNDVELTAGTEEEAVERASQECECDWSQSVHTGTTTSVIAVGAQ